jgi:HK97 family phage major capsid protein
MNLSEQAARLTELRDQIIDIASRDGELSEDDATSYEELNAEFDALRAEHDADWTRAAEYAARDQAVRNFAAGQYESSISAPNVIVGDKDPYDESYQRSVGTREAALRAIGETTHIGGDEKTEAERKLNLASSDRSHMRGFDEYLLTHNSDAYSKGFFKLMSGRGYDLEADEKAALRKAQQWDERTQHTFDEERGVTLTAANGGALIPAHLDPTVILSNSGTINPYRSISRVVPVMTNTWTGVVSAGVTMAWSSEGGDSSDVAPTFSSPAVTVHKAHGTVPATIEAFEDIQGLGGEIARLIQDGKDRLEGTAFTSGTGSGQPFGIVTAIYAESGLRETHATHSAFTATDLIDAQNLLPARYQANASFIASLTYLNRIRAFGTDDYYTWSATLDQPVSGTILGKPAYEVNDMSTALSTVTNTALVYGDFSNYLIADRVGTAVEFIPHLFSSGNGLPNGRRGWYAYWRVGADSVNNTAFVVSSNPGA